MFCTLHVQFCACQMGKKWLQQYSSPIAHKSKVKKNRKWNLQNLKKVAVFSSTIVQDLEESALYKDVFYGKHYVCSFSAQICLHYVKPSSVKENWIFRLKLENLFRLSQRDKTNVVFSEVEIPLESSFSIPNVLCKAHKIHCKTKNKIVWFFQR